MTRLREAGHEVRVLTRHTGASQPGVEFVTGDLATGQGLAQAAERVGTIVHCRVPDLAGPQILSFARCTRCRAHRPPWASGPGRTS